MGDAETPGGKSLRALFAGFMELVFLLPVMPNVLDVVVVLQHVDELLHVLQVALTGQSDVILGHHT